jgi:predicted GH43/DUF377 family glycosyl hydrolase
LHGFKTANLTDTSTGGNTLTITGWTGGGKLTGTADTVVDVASGNLTLSNASLSIGGLSMALSGITTANLTDTGSGHTFTVNGWSGGGSLGSSVTGNTETLTASEMAGLTLTNTSLTLSSGGTMSLASFKAAKLTVATASGNPQYVVDASGFSNGPTNVTINGGGNAMVFGGTAGKSILTAAGPGDDILIGVGAGDKLTDSGSGMNILIGGGPGGDTLTGNGNDILASGTTSYDADSAANIAALDAILAEWTSSDTYAMRYAKIFALKNGNRYQIWYTGQARGRSWIGNATSDNGKSWQRTSGRPVLSAEAPWENVAVMCPHVLYDEEAKLYRMWYSGGELYEPNAIGYATSADGLTWTKHKDNPIFKPEPKNRWEQDRVTGCQVIRQGDWFLMFYIGFQDGNTAQIGLARSRDGITGWQRHPANPLIRRGKNKWDHDAVYKPYAILDGQRWLLWYNGRKGGIEQIGLATHEGEDLGFGSH